MIARKSALIIVTHMLSGILGYVALFFVTRYMDPSAYGIMAFSYSFVAIFSVVGNLGFNHAHVKKISEGRDIGTCIGTFFVTKIGLACAMVVFTLLSIFVWTVFFGRGFETSVHEKAVYIMLVYWAVRVVAHSMVVTFQAKKEIAKFQLPVFFEASVRSLFIAFVAVSGWGVIPLVLCYIAGDVAYIVSSAVFFRGNNIKHPSFDFFKEYARFAFPLSIVVASMVIMNNIDRVFIQLFWSAKDVGYYFAAYSMVSFINLFTASIGLLLFPTFSYMNSKNDILGIKKVTLVSERYLSMIIFPMVIAVIVFARPISNVLLSGWGGTIPILCVLPLFVLFDALERPYQSNFLGMNRPHIARNRILIMFVANISLNIVLIPRDIQSIGLPLFGLGATGAAIATSVSYGIGLVYSRFSAWKITGVKGSSSVFVHGCIAVLVGLFFVVSQFFFSFQRWYLLLGAFLLFISLYFFLLYLFRAFTKNDLHIFLDSLNVKKMFVYIKDEIFN